MSNDKAAVQLVARDSAAPIHRAEGESIENLLAMLDKAEAFAAKLCATSFVPTVYKGKPQDAAAAVLYGHRIGLDPISALQGVAVINGRPCVWGDAALSVVRSHPDFEDMQERLERGDGNEENARAVCIITRRGQTPVERSFSVADAKRAGLWKKQGPWTQYPQRMLQMRARSWAMRDAFPDALTGMQIREEAEDYGDAREPITVTPIAPEDEGKRRPALAMPERKQAPEHPVEPDEDNGNTSPRDELMAHAESRNVSAEDVGRILSAERVLKVTRKSLDRLMSLVDQLADARDMRQDEPPDDVPADPEQADLDRWANGDEG